MSEVQPTSVPDPSDLEAVRLACLNAARDAYEDAGLRGLCPDGRWEAALGAISSLDLAALMPHPDGGPKSP